LRRIGRKRIHRRLLAAIRALPTIRAFGQSTKGRKRTGQK
jgi:hypothetical protein